MEKNEYVILKQNGELILSLRWLNDQKKEIIYPKIEKFLYENIIYLLLLMKEVEGTTDQDNRLDKTSFIEEHGVYIEEEVIFKLKQTFNLDSNSISRIRQKLNWGSEIDWSDIKKEAMLALSNMNISSTVTSTLFEEDHLDNSFIF